MTGSDDPTKNGLFCNSLSPPAIKEHTLNISLRPEASFMLQPTGLDVLSTTCRRDTLSATALGTVGWVDEVMIHSIFDKASTNRAMSSISST